MRRLVLMCLVALPACSAINAPGVVTPPRDAGSDVGRTDADPVDAALDGEVDAATDAGPSCTPRTRTERVCDDGRDDDCDGFIDCADMMDCGDAPTCCATGAGFVDETWQQAPVDWRKIPSSDTASLPTRARGELVSFGTDATPRGFRYSNFAGTGDGCLPLSLGASLSFAVSFDPETRPGEYAALVLTPATDMAAGRPLLAELRCEVGSNGTLSVRSASRELGRLAVGAMPFVVTLDTTPGADGGTSALYARVRVTNPDGSNPRTVVERVPFVLLRDLLRGPGRCRSGPGLYAAIEGVGSSVHVGRTSGALLQCANPTFFEPGPVLTAATLGFSGAWSTSLGAPSLSSAGCAAATSCRTTQRFEIAVDGSAEERDSEVFQHVSLSIGRTSGAFPASWGVDGVGNPSVGSSPPAFAAATAREPTIVAELDANRAVTGRVGVLAVESSTAAGMRDRFVLARATPPAVLSDPFVAGAPLVTPTQDPACSSLRDPSLVRATRDVAGGYWLFYTCERDGGLPSELHAVRVSRAITLMDTPVTVLAPRTLNADYAFQGMRAPEVVVSFGSLAEPSEDGGMVNVEVVTFRMWFVALDRRYVATLAMAQAQAKVTGASTTLPTFEPYAGNPVLRADQLTGATCAGPCTVTGFASLIDLDPEAHRARMILARRVEAPGGVLYELVPLTQPLEAFWSAPP